ncbi:MAG: FG-GAP repeat protein [Deltaproteobacteria bacterium]|nr:FG-GAP repeat protein [Deltaproteobacteria bacterium]
MRLSAPVLPALLATAGCRVEPCTCDTGGTTWYADRDADGYGDDSVTQVACTWPPGTVVRGGDCDDRDPTIHPGAWDACDGVDQDCDGEVDEDAETFTWYADGDGDGYGDAGQTLEACARPDASSDRAGDCDDQDPNVHPEAEETCDGVDQDCDGETDEVEPFWWWDADGDGWGDDRTRSTACDWPHGPPQGWVDRGGDCDDGDPGICPGAEDLLGDGVDQDCDGFADDLPLDAADRAYMGWWNGEASGTALTACDMNGDGTDDLLVGAPLQATGGDAGGSVYVLLGGKGGPSSGTPHLFYADVRLWGEGGSRSGSALACLPDQDGDGVDEAIVGACEADGIWIVPGNATWASGGGTDLAEPLSLAGLWLAGHEGGTGRAVARAGDVDGDRQVDLLVGAPDSDGGRAFLLGGRPSWSADAISDACAVVSGDESGDGLGSALGGADLDGDGLADLALGAPGTGGPGVEAGSVHLFLGPVRGLHTAGDADATWTGTAGDRAAATLAVVSDLDGDGLDDLLVGAPGASEGAGAIHVVPGGALSGGGTLSDLPDRISGEAPLDAAVVVSSVGDANDDGLGDLLVGGPGAGEARGAVWLVLGPVEGDLVLDAADQKWFGEEGGLGTAVSAGDLDGDEIMDLVFSAPRASDVYTQAGITWVFLGSW